MSQQIPDWEMPQGLGQAMGHNTRAMDTFFSLDHLQQKQVISYVQGAQTGEEAQSRMEHTMKLLSEGAIDQLL